MGTGESYEGVSEKSIPDKITTLKSLAISFEMKCKGFKFDVANNKWVPSGTGMALAGSNTIDAGSGIIATFAENINLITSKDIEKFTMEFTDAFFKFNVMLLNDPATPAENHKPVIKMFKDTLSNIGDIITSSKGLIGKVFDNPQLLEDNNESYI